MVIGFSILIGVTVSAYRDAPPIPDQVTLPAGQAVFSGDDIRSGQQIFLKYGLMENGTILGHGAYLGPDFSTAYLHDLGQMVAQAIAKQLFGQRLDSLGTPSQDFSGLVTPTFPNIYPSPLPCAQHKQFNPAGCLL